MTLWIPKNAGNFLTSKGPVSFSRTLTHGVSYSVSHSVSQSVVITDQLSIATCNIGSVGPEVCEKIYSYRGGNKY